MEFCWGCYNPKGKTQRIAAKHRAGYRPRKTLYTLNPDGNDDAREVLCHRGGVFGRMTMIP